MMVHRTENVASTDVTSKNLCVWRYHVRQYRYVIIQGDEFKKKNGMLLAHFRLQHNVFTAMSWSHGPNQTKYWYVRLTIISFSTSVTHIPHFQKKKLPLNKSVIFYPLLVRVQRELSFLYWRRRHITYINKEYLGSIELSLNFMKTVGSTVSREHYTLCMLTVSNL